MKKKINFNRVYLMYVLNIVICYMINGSVENPLEWYLIAIVPFVFTIVMYVIFMLILFLRSAFVSIHESLK